MATKEAKQVKEVENELSTNVNIGIEIDRSDIEIPRINVSQKMSQGDAPVGSIVFDRKHVVAGPNEKISAIAVVAQKGWRENIPFDADEVPRIAWSKEESEAISDDSEYQMTEFAEITLLLRQPEGNDDDTAFSLVIGDSRYALGKINVGKNAYRTTYKILATSAAFNPNTPICARVWNFVSEEFSKGKYTWFNPSLTATTEVTEEAVLEFIKNFGG